MSYYIHRWHTFLENFWSGLNVNLNVQIFRNFKNDDKDKVHDFMGIVNSSINSSRSAGSNLTEYFRVILTEQKSEFQIHLDDCHFWYKRNTTTEANLIECITSFCFSVYRYFHKQIVDNVVNRENVITEVGDISEERKKKKNSIYFLINILIFF